MRDNAFRTYMLVMGVVMLSGTALLIFENARAPGFCPSYPVIGTPACIVIFVYFSAMFAALFMGRSSVSRGLFFAGCVLALLTSFYFSGLEILTPGQQCPQLFGIPLPPCFTVPFMVLPQLFWGVRGARLV